MNDVLKIYAIRYQLKVVMKGPSIDSLETKPGQIKQTYPVHSNVVPVSYHRL
jgi:hypothetical protein